MAELLSQAQAELVLTHLDMGYAEEVAARFKGQAIEPGDVFKIEGDLFPAALGGTINDRSLSHFGYKIVAGSANNQLEDEIRHGIALKDKGILDAPDYVINAGGLINVWNQLQGYNKRKALKEVEGIYKALKQIFMIAEKEDLPTNLASNRLGGASD